MALMQINVNGGHFMEEDLSLFDAPFFNMTSDEAAVRFMKDSHFTTELMVYSRPWIPNRDSCLK